MKRIICFCLLTFFFFCLKPVFAITSLDNLGSEIQKKVSEQIKSSIGDNKLFGTFSDPEYKNYSNQFSLGQKVYVRISIAGCDDEEKTVALLDSNKTKMFGVKLTKESDSPCVLSGSFDAPKYDGVFYLDAKISSNNGTNFAGQMNISVGKGGSYVSTSVENKVVTEKIGGPTLTVTATVTPTNTPMITYAPKTNDAQNISSIIREFFKKLASIFTKNK